MPEKATIERVRQKKRAGKAPTTQAGEFVREEVEHVKAGKHRGKSRKQAIAIGLSKARRAGVPVKPPKKGQAKEKTRRTAERAYLQATRGQKKSPRSRSQTSRSRKGSTRRARS